MHCRIRVKGHLGPSWSNRLAGLRIAHEDGGTSLLSGPLPDQAALHGVLLQLVRMGLPLLALETCEEPPREETEAAGGAGCTGEDGESGPVRP
jgi:hypothetical protein